MVILFIIVGNNTCVANGNCYSPVRQWNTCLPSDVCATNTMCCFGSASDRIEDKKTCRPSSFCHSGVSTTNILKTTTTIPTTFSSATAILKPIAPVLPDPNYQGGYKWPNRIFAPLVDVSIPNSDFLFMSSKVGSARYIIGFISNNGWNGTDPISKLSYLKDIQSVRMFGGDVIVSFGGPGRTELAQVATTPRILQIAYQNVVDAYSLSWIDFFLDSVGVADEKAVNLRNSVLRNMQVLNPNLRISYSLPVTPNGLKPETLYVLQSAVRAGVRVDGKFLHCGM
jgi:hypothetical protein